MVGRRLTAWLTDGLALNAAAWPPPPAAAAVGVSGEDGGEALSVSLPLLLALATVEAVRLLTSLSSRERVLLQHQLINE